MSAIIKPPRTIQSPDPHVAPVHGSFGPCALCRHYSTHREPRPESVGNSDHWLERSYLITVAGDPELVHGRRSDHQFAPKRRTDRMPAQLKANSACVPPRRPHHVLANFAPRMRAGVRAPARTSRGARRWSTLMKALYSRTLPRTTRRKPTQLPGRRQARQFSSVTF